MRRIPLPVKLGYTVWLAVWIPVYWWQNGLQNFLWLCDMASLLLGVALWLESPLVLSAQAVGVLVIQLLWNLDFFAYLLFRVHPIGGTEYMFDTTQPLWFRLFSLFHTAMPPLLLWALTRLGYDRRAWRAQTALTWVVLPITFFFADPAKNINWVVKPFEKAQTVLPPAGYLLAMLVLLPLLLYGPSHWALRRLFAPPRGERDIPPAEPTAAQLRRMA